MRFLIKDIWKYFIILSCLSNILVKWCLMKWINLLQVVQHFSKTAPEVIEVPFPSENDYKIIIKTSVSLISSGTERSLVNFSKSNIFQKAFDQPDKVKQALEKSKTDGFLST